MTINQISNNNNDNAGHCRSCYVNSFCCPCATPLENAGIGSIRYPWLFEKCFFKGNMFRDCMKSFKCSSQTLLYKEELMVGRSSIYHTTTLEAASICIYHTTIFKRFFSGSISPSIWGAHNTWRILVESVRTAGNGWKLGGNSLGGKPGWESTQKAGEKKGNPNHHNARKPFRFRNVGIILSVLPRTWGVVKQRPFFKSWVRG